MSLDQLQRHYDRITVDPESERRVRDAVLAAAPQPARGRQLLLSLAAAVVVAAIAIVVAVTRPGHGRTEPTGSTTPPPTAAIPSRRPGAVTGAVLRSGRPVDAQVQVVAWPAVIGHLKKGQPAPTRTAGSASTDSHGGFVIDIPTRVLVPRFLSGPFIELEVDVSTSQNETEWDGSLRVVHGRTRALQLIFDFGRNTLTVNGKTSPLN